MVARQAWARRLRRPTPLSWPFSRGLWERAFCSLCFVCPESSAAINSAQSAPNPKGRLTCICHRTQSDPHWRHVSWSRTQGSHSTTTEQRNKEFVCTLVGNAPVPMPKGQALVMVLWAHVLNGSVPRRTHTGTRSACFASSRDHGALNGPTPHSSDDFHKLSQTPKRLRGPPDTSTLPFQKKQQKNKHMCDVCLLSTLPRFVVKAPLSTSHPAETRTAHHAATISDSG